MSSPKSTSPEMIEMSAVEGVLTTPHVKTKSFPPTLPMSVHRAHEVRKSRDGVVPEVMIDRARMGGFALDAAALVPQVPADARDDRRPVHGFGVKPRALFDVKLDEGGDCREIHERDARRNAVDVHALFKENVLQQPARVAVREVK